MKRAITKLIPVLWVCLFINQVSAQDIRENNIRGRVLDKASQYALPGVNVILASDKSKLNGTTTDADGYFKIANVPVGRHEVKISFIGYKEIFLSNIIVTSGKEVVLNIEMEESLVELDAVVITGTNSNTESLNDMISVSSRGFASEETERYAGSRQDPARMASNFAGVQGADDSRNDIVIRGNSPLGILWKYEDVDIPNPNHFAIAGSTGGAVSVLNNKVIGASDFLTGAFPAEYGNGIAGVFDLKMRNGNDENYEFSGQFGLFGTELMAEGPISRKNRSSYLATYRYSTLKIFETINFNLGTTAVPNYQDYSFKLNFPTAKKGTFSVFSIGGLSKIAILVSTYTEPKSELYGEKDRDQYFNTSMGVIGVTHKYPVNKNTFTKLTLAASGSDINSHHDMVVRRASDYGVDRMYSLMDYKFLQGKVSLAFSLHKKVNLRHSLKAGINLERMSFNMQDSVFDDNTQTWENRFDTDLASYFVQPYVQWKYDISDKLAFNAGLHAQRFFMNESFALEPRAGLRYRLNAAQTLSLGYGNHSQAQPYYIYFYHLPGKETHNQNLDFSRSQHFALGYDYVISRFFRIKAETYYQRLSNIPVEVNPSSFSILNQGSGFARFFPDTLTNAGTGFNYGLEFTLEKFFSQNYFFLFTASVFDSKYKGSDGVERNTDFNGNFATNLLGGYEKAFREGGHTIFKLGGKLTWSGGRWYSPVDTAKTNQTKELEPVDELRNTLQFKNYFRLDAKLGIKINAKRLTHEIAIDIINTLNTHNVLKLSYDPDIALLEPGKNPVREEPQLGMLPVFYYKVDF